MKITIKLFTLMLLLGVAVGQNVNAVSSSTERGYLLPNSNGKCGNGYHLHTLSSGKEVCKPVCGPGSYENDLGTCSSKNNDIRTQKTLAGAFSSKPGGMWNKKTWWN